MPYKFITDPDHISMEKWQRFVDQHAAGNVFQTPFMYRVYRDSDTYHPLTCFLLDDSGEIKAMMLAVIQEFANGLAKRIVVSGGPLIQDNAPDLLHDFLARYNAWAQDQAIYTELRNSVDTAHLQSEFEDNDYSYEEHLNILIDLKKVQDTLWREVHSKRRNEIRRAGREGTTFENAADADTLHKCYAILQEVYGRAKLPLPPDSLFEAAHKLSTKENGLRVFIARNSGVIIGTMLALAYKNTLYDWYAGSYRQYYNKYPNDLIPWEVFLWGQENGFELFDFGGAGKPGVPYGVREYKKKFGGEFVNYGRYQCIHQPVKMRLAHYGFKTWQAVKKVELLRA